MITRLKSVVAQFKQEILYQFPATRPRRILFDHLPKCGGSSIKSYLGGHYPKRKIFSINGLNPAESVALFKSLPKQDRYGFNLVKGHLANDLLNFVHPKCLKVTVLREPVERIVSHYFYARRRPEHYLYSCVHKSQLTVEDYASSNLSTELRNWYTSHFSGLTVDEAEQRPEKSIKIAADVILEKYDIVGFLDDLLSFTLHLRNQANFIYKYKNIRVNVNPENPNLNTLPQGVIKKIEQVNFLDVALYKKIRDNIG